MHDHPTDLTEYEWPVCVTPGCGRQLWVSEAGRWACKPCEDRTSTRLTELPALFRQLDTIAALMRGARRVGGGGSGTKNPPIPPRLEVLALTANGGVATRLQAIEDSWRHVLEWEIPQAVDERTTFPVTRDAGGRVRVGRPVKDDRVYPHWRTQTGQKTAPDHVKFLINNLPWACDAYESVGQDIEEIRKLHAECTGIVNDKPKYGNVKIGLCPVVIEDRLCAEQLYASARSFKTACSICRSGWEGEEEWRQLRAAQEQVLAEAAGVAA